MLRLTRERVDSSPSAKAGCGVSNSLFIKVASVLFCAGFLSLGFATTTHAATYYWVGGTTSASTSNPVNWNTVAGACANSANATVPSPADTVNFVSNCVNNATVDSALSVVTFTMSSGYTGTTTLNANLTVTGVTALTVDGGTLDVINGKTLTTNGTSIIGNAVNTNGNVIVDGTGSTWTHNVSGSRYLQVGGSGTGKLTISNGGTVNSNIKTYIGFNSGSSGIVIVNGTGSIFAPGNQSSIGNSGSGMLTISNGGVTNYTGANSYVIANSAGSVGEVDVIGTGSQLNVPNANFITGNSGTGITNISNGGAVTAKWQVSAGYNAGSTGTLNIGVGGTSGTITITTLVAADVFGGSGTSTLNFNHSDPSYTFPWLILGSLKVNHLGTGTTTLYGSNTYTGTTTLSAGTLVTGNATAIGSSTLIMNTGSTFNIASSTLNVWGNWTNNGGVFMPNSGTVTFSSTTQSITGSNTWNNLALTASSTLTFPSGAIQTIGGTLSCLGTAISPITLKSSTPGTPATLSKSSGIVNCDYLSLTDSAATGGSAWNQGTHSTSVSGNSGWLINTGSPATVALTSPASPITASSTINLTATTSNDLNMAGVTFYQGTTTIGGEITATSSPHTYTTSWNTASFADGSSTTITAVARDVFNNYATSTGVVVTVDNSPPAITLGKPIGTFAVGTAYTQITVHTDENAICKYSTSAGTNYNAMTAFSTTGAQDHSQTITSLQNNTSYNYYVKCQDTIGNTDPTDYTISFSVAAVVTSSGGRSSGGGLLSPAQLAALLASSASTTAYLNSLVTSTVLGCPRGMHCTPNPIATTSPAFTFTLSLAVGSQGNEVMQLQQLLIRLGYLSTTPTGYFGAKTEQALKKLQTTHGLAGVGIVGPLTRTLLNSLQSVAPNTPVQLTTNTPSTTKYQFSHNLTIESQGDDVTKLQTILNIAGFLKVSPTGYFGSMTQDAVKAYQAAHSITPTGFVGTITRGELNK